MGEKYGVLSVRPRLHRRFERSRLETEVWEAVYEELLRVPVAENQQPENLDPEPARMLVA
jgi:hypothetical protein